MPSFIILRHSHLITLQMCVYDADADGSGLSACACVSSVCVSCICHHQSSTKLTFSIVTFAKLLNQLMIMSIIYTAMSFFAQESTIQKQFHSIFRFKLIQRLCAT